MGLPLPDGVPEKDEPPTFPGSVTYYFPIDLGGATGLKGKPVTGVFFPQGYSYPDPIDVVLFFHGDKQKWSTIWDYWKPGNVHDIALRQAINDAGKSVVLIAPTMGATPGASGKMTGSLDANSADDLLDNVLDFMQQKVPQYKKKPKVGRIVLAAHSGGGETMLRQTMIMKKYASNIRACWGFDSTYGFTNTSPNANNWITWALFHRNVENYFHYHKGADTETVAVAIDNMASGDDPLPHKPKEKLVYHELHNVHVHGSGHGHYDQLNYYFPMRIADVFS